MEELLARDKISYLYHAIQLSMDRPVALKVLAAHAVETDSAAVECFIAAARAGGKLNHPNIMQVYDAGEEQGTYFVALEHVAGRSVRRLMIEQGRNRPLPLRQALEIVVQIAGALECAHGQLVLHRCVSPDTILVTSHGIAKLANMGCIQGPEDPCVLETPKRTLESVPYFAPEQLFAEPVVTVQSDIYSLGAVLFLLVTGQPPFRGATEDEIVRRIISGERDTIRRLLRAAPDALAKTVERAMARAPEERFQNAAELRAALERVLEDLE